MPRYNVESDGKWACFSTVTESFITEFMSREEYEKWRDAEYGKSKCPLEQANAMMFRDALRILSFNRTPDEFYKNLEDCGIVERKN